MSPEDFILKYLNLHLDRKRYCNNISNIGDLIIPTEWAFRRDVAQLVSHIKSPCDFESGNGCIKSRALPEHEIQAYPALCCSACYENIGYFIALENNKKVISDIASLFMEETGFWDKNKGCVLPRRYRSSICLSYFCEEAVIKSTRDKLLLSFFVPLGIFGIIRSSIPVLKDIYSQWRKLGNINHLEREAFIEREVIKRS